MLWKQELGKRIKSRAGLEKFFTLSSAEKEWFEKTENGTGGKSFGFFATPYFLSLAGKDKNDPIRRQCVPRADEFIRRPGELRDPLGDEIHTRVPRLIHRYRDRALLLVTDECAVSCRYCFRRYYAGRGGGSLGGEELKIAAAYLKSHPGIKECLLSGGDPLTLDDESLFEISDMLREARPALILRFSSRIPVVLPSRITRRLARGLGRRRPFWGIIHVNHPRELGPACTEALSRLVEAGVPLLSQTVLLRGVNDDAAVLEELFRGLISRGVKPYYLFQGDLAEGTGHFRVSPERGWEIMRALRNRVSNLALPEYAVDLPGGGGKIPLARSYLKGEDKDSWIFENIEGKEYRYPKEKYGKR
jgi:lysine 2,3-aminomutase